MLCKLEFCKLINIEFQYSMYEMYLARMEFKTCYRQIDNHTFELTSIVPCIRRSPESI